MTRSPDHDGQSGFPTRLGKSDAPRGRDSQGQVGWIEIISGSMFSGGTDIYEARCQRCFEPLPAEKGTRVKEAGCD